MFGIISIVRHDLMKPGKLACLFVWPKYIGEIEVGQLCLKVCVFAFILPLYIRHWSLNLVLLHQQGKIKPSAALIFLVCLPAVNYGLGNPGGRKEECSIHCMLPGS